MLINAPSILMVITYKKPFFFLLIWHFKDIRFFGTSVAMNEKQDVCLKVCHKCATHAFGLLTQISLYLQGINGLTMALHNGMYVGWETGKALGKVAIIHRNHLVIPPVTFLFPVCQMLLAYPINQLCRAAAYHGRPWITFPCFCVLGSRPGAYSLLSVSHLETHLCPDPDKPCPLRPLGALPCLSGSTTRQYSGSPSQSWIGHARWFKMHWRKEEI